MSYLLDLGSNILNQGLKLLQSHDLYIVTVVNQTNCFCYQLHSQALNCEGLIETQLPCFYFL